MDILKGKILKKPELVEEGQLKKSGEKKDETQDDAEDVSPVSDMFFFV